MADSDKVTVDLTTGIGTISFPHLFEQTKSTNDKGETVYDVQLLIPKSDRETARAIMAAFKKVAEAKWGDNWKKVRNPLRDADKEKDDVTDDGKTKGEKYPERLGHYFINARSYRPVSVVGRDRAPITDHTAVYGGCKGKINVSFYAYAKQGNTGVGCGLNGVQKIADGEPFGNAAPPVESMFDLVDDGDDFDLDGEPDEIEEETPAPAPKKRAAKKAAAPVVEVEDGEDDLLDDLDDLD